MFGVGLPEMAVIALVAVLVFGPDRLPEFARQAGRMVRQLKQFADSARDDIRAELGPEYSNFELTDLDPRRAVRKYMQDAWDEDTDTPSKGRTLGPGDRPPYDADAT
ncbi:MAG: sec-independent translocase [Nocardioidaceae bacterium]